MIALTNQRKGIDLLGQSAGFQLDAGDGDDDDELLSVEQGPLNEGPWKYRESSKEVAEGLIQVML